MPNFDFNAETDQNQISTTRSDKISNQASLGVELEFKQFDDGEASESSRNGIDGERRKNRDRRRLRMRSGDSTESVEGIERRDRARGDDAVERLLSVQRREGGRGVDEGEWLNEDIAVNAEQLLTAGTADGERSVEDFSNQFEIMPIELRYKNYTYHAMLKPIWFRLHHHLPPFQTIWISLCKLLWRSLGRDFTLFFLFFFFFFKWSCKSKKFCQ